MEAQSFTLFFFKSFFLSLHVLSRACEVFGAKKHTFFKSNMVGLFGKANLKLDMIQVGQCLFNTV